MIYLITFGGLAIVAVLFWWSDRRAASKPRRRQARPRGAMYVLKTPEEDEGAP